MSSRGPQQSPVVFEDLSFDERPDDKWSAYGQSKTANVLWAAELERRLGARGVHALARHPGILPTDLSRHMERDDFQHVRSRAPGGRMRGKSIESGAATSVWAVSEELVGERFPF